MHYGITNLKYPLIQYSLTMQVVRQIGKEVFNVEDQTREDSKTRIFCRYIVKNGKRIYPKTSRYFSFLVSDKK